MFVIVIYRKCLVLGGSRFKTCKKWDTYPTHLSGISELYYPTQWDN
jgi:hypothetical protein